LSNFCEISRTKSAPRQWKGDGHTPTLYWLKQAAGKFTLPRCPAILNDPACSILAFISFIAQDPRLPARCRCRFSLFLENFLDSVPGSFWETIGTWRSVILPSPSGAKNHRENCAVLGAPFSSGWGGIFFEAS